MKGCNFDYILVCASMSIHLINIPGTKTLQTFQDLSKTLDFSTTVLSKEHNASS